MGDMTLRPVLGQDGVTASFASGDDPAALYSVFAAHGGYPFGSVGKADAAHGAVAVTVASLAPGEKKTLSLVFAWHFPDRDFSRIILGNMYTELWADSAAVAQSLASESKLASVVADINTGAIEARTVPPVFLRLGAERLRKARDWFTTVVANSREPGMAAAFKADGTPEAGRRRTWEEAIRDSDMDADRKAFWLSGDT